MLDNYQHALELVLGAEGGFSNHPRDPGGPTFKGITLSTLSAWRKKTCSVSELKAMSDTEITDIYRRQYADQIDFDELPDGLDYCIFDTAVNSGPARAAMELQKILGVVPDGILGAKTIAAIGTLSVARLISRYCAARLDYMSNLATWTEFGAGWSSRVARVEVDAGAMHHDTVVGATAGMSVPSGEALQPIPATASAKATGPVELVSTPAGKTSLATVASVALAVLAAASQASGMLSPYSGIAAVRYVLLGLALASSVSTLVVAAQHARTGTQP